MDVNTQRAMIELDGPVFDDPSAYIAPKNVAQHVYQGNWAYARYESNTGPALDPRPAVHSRIVHGMSCGACRYEAPNDTHKPVSLFHVRPHHIAKAAVTRELSPEHVAKVMAHPTDARDKKLDSHLACSLAAAVTTLVFLVVFGDRIAAFGPFVGGAVQEIIDWAKRL